MGSAVMLPPPVSSDRCGRALQQTGVQIEHVAGVGLAAGGALEQQAQRAVGDGVLGQVVVDDQHVLAVMHKVLADARMPA